MHDKKLIFSDNGKGHFSNKWAWAGLVCSLLGNVLTFCNQWARWEQTQQFYFLWYELPDPPSINRALAISIFLIIAAVLNTIATAKNEIHIYEDGIEGYGFKFWGLWVRRFELKFEDIMSMKASKWGMTIRSKKGRYVVIVHHPKFCAELIQQNAIILSYHIPIKGNLNFRDEKTYVDADYYTRFRNQ